MHFVTSIPCSIFIHIQPRSASPDGTGHLRHVIRAMCPGALRCEVNGVDRAGSEMGTEINEIDHVLAALRWVRIQSHKPVSKGSRLAQASVCSGGEAASTKQLKAIISKFRA